MLKLKQNYCTSLLLAIFMLFTSGSLAASGPQNFDGVDAGVELGTFYRVDTSAEKISVLNTWIQSAVEAGKVSLDKGEQAQNIWISLQQYLARQSAKNRQLESRIMKSDDNARLKATRDLNRNVVEQERVLISAYLAIKKIADAEGFNGEKLIPGQGKSHFIKDETPSVATAVKTEATGEKSAVKIEFSNTDALIKDLE